MRNGMNGILLAKSAGSIAVMSCMIAAFAAVAVGIGVRCRKRATDVDGFVLAGRNVGPWLTAFTYGTSYFSAVIFIGYAGQFGYLFGVASAWIGIGNAVVGSFLPWMALGRRTRVMTQSMGARTMPEFFGKRYDSDALKIASALIAFVFLIPYTASLFNGLSRLFGVAFGFRDETTAYAVIVCLMAILTAAYVMAGGYMATAANDFIQGIVMLVGIVAVVATVLSANGGLVGSMSKLANEAGWEYASFFGKMPAFMFFVIVLTSLGTWGLPQMVGKFYSIKSEGDIKKGAIISAAFALIVAGGCYFLGGFGRLFVDAGVPYDAIVPTMLDKTVKSDFLMGLMVILVLGASMSTLSCLVLTSSSALTLDLIKTRIAKKEMGEKREMLVMRCFVAVFIAISAAIAIVQKVCDFSEIASLMGISWGALAGAFLAPFVYGLYSKKVTKTAVWASFANGIAIMLFAFAYQLAGGKFLVATLKHGETLDFGNSIIAGAIAMLGGLAIVPVASATTYRIETKKGILDPRRVDAIFAAFGGKVLVPVTDSLGEAEDAPTEPGAEGEGAEGRESPNSPGAA